MKTLSLMASVGIASLALFGIIPGTVAESAWSPPATATKAAYAEVALRYLPAHPQSAWIHGNGVMLAQQNQCACYTLLRDNLDEKERQSG